MISGDLLNIKEKIKSMKDSAAMKSKRWFLSINLLHYFKTCGTSENLYWLMTLQKRVECLINEREIIRLEKEILLSNYMDGLSLVIVDVSETQNLIAFSERWLW